MIYNVGVMLLNNTLTTCHIFYLYAIELYATRYEIDDGFKHDTR